MDASDNTIYHSTYGALLIGFCTACAVFGVLTQQTVTYYQRYFHDKIVYKSLVGILWVLECIDLAFIGYAVYFYIITHHGDLSFFLNGEILWALIVQIIFGAFVGTIVKCAFALRVWTFSKKNVWITGLIMLLILAQAGLAIAYCVRAFQLRKVEYSKRLQVIATLSLGSGVVTDIAIALALCYFLRKLKTGFRKSDSLVNMLSIYAINTGILTSALSATVVILYNVYPSAMYFMGSYFVLANVYGISFICTLNTRRVVRGKGTDQSGSSGNTSENGPRNAIFMITNPSIGGHRSNGAPYTGHTTSKGGVEIGVRQEVTIITDIESQGGVDSASTGESTPIKSAARSGYADPIVSVLLYDYEQQSLYAIGGETGPASQGERLAREDT